MDVNKKDIGSPKSLNLNNQRPNNRKLVAMNSELKSPQSQHRILPISKSIGVNQLNIDSFENQDA